jgi:hypothetical protein
VLSPPRSRVACETSVGIQTRDTYMQALFASWNAMPVTNGCDVDAVVAGLAAEFPYAAG